MSGNGAQLRDWDVHPTSSLERPTYLIFLYQVLPELLAVVLSVCGDVSPSRMIKRYHTLAVMSCFIWTLFIHSRGLVEVDLFPGHHDHQIYPAGFISVGPLEKHHLRDPCGLRRQARHQIGYCCWKCVGHGCYSC